MLVLDFCQHVQETKDPDCAHEQRERNVYFLDVNFKWGENYKKHISRTQSQGQRPVRQCICTPPPLSATVSKFFETIAQSVLVHSV